MFNLQPPIAPGPARASCPTMHSAPCPTSNCCLSTGRRSGRKKLPQLLILGAARLSSRSRTSAWPHLRATSKFEGPLGIVARAAKYAFTLSLRRREPIEALFLLISE
jgi:hypothetical protein